MSKLDAASKVSPSLQAELDEHFTKMAPVIDAINAGMAATTPAALAATADQLAAIEHNKTAGLLCACNKVRVPYGPPPGTVEKDGIVHGYDDCATRAENNADSYGNAKVDALLAGQISISGGTFTERDFVALALAALDQAGVSASLQRRVNELVADEIEGAELHVQPCGFGIDGAACYGCELNAKASR
jgi:hypothetical protein